MSKYIFFINLNRNFHEFG